MGRPKGSTNKDRNEIEEQVEEQEESVESSISTLPVKEGSLASDKKTTVIGIHEGKKPKFDRETF